MPEDEVAYDRRTASGIIHKNACHLCGAIVSPKQDKKSYIDIYDGESTSQEKVLRLRTNTGTGNHIVFTKPILMRRGLYVYLHDDAEEYTVFWKSIED